MAKSVAVQSRQRALAAVVAGNDKMRRAASMLRRMATDERKFTSFDDDFRARMRGESVPRTAELTVDQLRQIGTYLDAGILEFGRAAYIVRTEIERRERKAS
jgi:hypothetical protein